MLKRPGNDIFRAHFGFLALMLTCFACLVYLMGTLRSIFRPFLWALFLVMALSPAVSLVETGLLCLGNCVCRCVSAFCSAVCYALACLNAKRKQIATASRFGSSTKRSSQAHGNSRDATASPEIIGSVSETPSPQLGEEVLVSEHLGDRKVPNPCVRVLVHGVAIAIVVAGVVLAIGGIVLMIIQSMVDLQEHWSVYKIGAQNVADTAQRIAAHATGSMPQNMAEDISQSALVKAEELITALVRQILGNLWRAVLEFLMMALYIAFWLSAPMPLGTQMEELLRRYILLKGVACLGYGICVGLLLHFLRVDLAAPFGLFAFFLSFVPEVGAIVAMILPAPVILFDSRLDSPAMTLFAATTAQLGLKFVFANVVEVKLVEADQLMKMHPVIILLAVTFFGFTWGPTGMLLAVPLVAYFKVALLSDTVPACYRDPVLVVLEGDRGAPAKYAQKRGVHILAKESQHESCKTAAPESGEELPAISREV